MNTAKRIDKEAIKQSTDIVRLIEEHVLLRKAGSVLRGLCPFHEEKTASFTVYPNTQTFHCFGCGATGDAIKFIELIRKVSFTEALRYLSERSGGHDANASCVIPVKTGVPKSKKKEKPDERVLKIYEEIFPLCRKALLEEPEAKCVRDYLAKERGIGPDDIAKLRIGAYLPSHREHVSKKYGSPLDGDSHNSLARMSGLVSYGAGYNYQIVLPHYGQDGRISGLTFRLIKEGRDRDNQPLGKYKNTPLLDKDYLFNLYHAAPFIREKGEAVIVEGHFDVLTLLLAGMDNVICLGDTSLSNERLHALLEAGARKVILWFDNDGPGLKSCQKAVQYLLLENKAHVLVVSCAFKDAGDINTDPNKLKIIENSLTSAALGAVWLAKRIVDACKSDNDKIDAIEEAKQIYRQIADTYLKKEFIKKVARGINVKMEYLAADGEVKKSTRGSNAPNNKALLFSDLKNLVDKTEDIGAVGRYINRFYSMQKGARMPQDLREALVTMNEMVNKLEVGALREYILENHAARRKE